MKNLINLIVIPLLITFSQVSTAAVLTFDNVPGGSIKGAFGDMPIYQGFSFSPTLDWIDVQDPSYFYGAKSGRFALINNAGGVGTIIESSTTDFTFRGLWAKRSRTAPDSGGADSLFGSLSGYRDGSLVWQLATGLNGSYEYYAAQTGLIDELRLGFGNYFLVDDLELTAVPVPAAAWLFSSGLIALLGIARKRSKT
ncbi:MAG: VPLPA-CTERM sorting domain-containing protein [Gammaproteobacteria bacterium]|nr:VPLPA-CTERM sorting domain-containing protein [Gammaproteobacteria bacterium]